jgi:hypothetical protein
MAKRKLAPGERGEIGGVAAVRTSVERPGRIVRVLVAPHTNEAGEPQVAMTSEDAEKT